MKQKKFTLKARLIGFTALAAIIGLSMSALSLTGCSDGSGNTNGETIHTHSYGEWSVKTPASCTAAEVQERKCSCGDTQEQTVGNPLPHTFAGGICEVCGADDPDFVETLSDIEEIIAYLSRAAGGTTVDKPLTLSVKINLTNMAPGSNWDKILQALDAAGKFVNLNLSECTLNGTIFNPYGVSAAEGKDKIVNITLPDSVTGITAGSSAAPSFKDFSNMVSFSSEKLSGISDYAFGNCTSLAMTALPEGVKSIGVYAFQNCASLALTALPEGAAISAGAFQNCASLALTALPGGIASIGSNTFYGCTNLALTALPAGITSIGSNAFQNCANLALTALPEGLTSIGNSTFQGCSRLALTALPAGVTSIGNYAFSDCTSLALTALPVGVTSIGNSAFQKCSRLALTALPAGVTSIGIATFQNCTSLAITALPEKVSVIYGYAFYGCTGLTSIDLPAGLTSIGGSAFYGCANLSTVNCLAVLPPVLDSTIFTSTSPALVIYVYNASVAAYKAAEYWNIYSGRIKGFCDDGHNYPAWTEPTCTTAGNSERTCSRCGNVDTRSSGFAALGHDWNTIKEPISAGVEAIKCKRSGCTGISDVTLTYHIGDTGPAGGVIFYVADGQEGRQSGITVQGCTGIKGSFDTYTAYYLEAARTDENNYIKWGPYNVPLDITTIVPTISDPAPEALFFIGNGRRDTCVIANFLETYTAETGPFAAQICANKTVAVGAAEFNDWFLPSIGELLELFKAKGKPDVPTANHYWSSSQNNGKDAYTRNFSDTTSAWYVREKYREESYIWVRAIRAF